MARRANSGGATRREEPQFGQAGGAGSATWARVPQSRHKLLGSPSESEASLAAPGAGRAGTGSIGCGKSFQLIGFLQYQPYGITNQPKGRPARVEKRHGSR